MRALGPAVTSPANESWPPCAGTRPREGFTPTTPQVAAGIRTDPPPSEPIANGTRPAATAAAAPPEEPPAPVDTSHGFRTAGRPAGSVNPVSPNSDAVVAPRDTAPVASSAATIASVRSAARCAPSREAVPETAPARRASSFSATGTPESGADP